MRRWMTMLVVWVSLLGMALPTFACARHGHTCCSPDSQSACAGHSPDNGRGIPLSLLGSGCCADAPAITRVPTAQIARIQLEPNDLSHAPDPLGMLLWVLAAHSPERDRGRAVHIVPLYQANASLTYLRTARLRL